MSKPTHQAMVIGGGPSGAAAAILLARAGKQVCLLERKKTDHHKVCGEFISWEATHYLQQLGVDLGALGAQRIHNFRLYNGDSSLEAALPFPAWSLSRKRLDGLLLSRAEEAGVAVLKGAAVRGLQRTETAWLATTTSPASGGASDSAERVAQGERHAETIFLASGKHDLRNLRRQPVTQRRRKPPTDDLIGLKMHLCLAPAQQEKLQGNVEIHLFNGGYAGLEPIEDGKANLCFLVSKDVHNACKKDWAKMLAWLGNASPHLRDRLAGSESLWSRPLAVYGTPYGYIYKPEADITDLYRLGDQMAVIPSFAGDGISIALHSGVLAARAYVAGDSAYCYHQRARNDFAAPVRNAQFLANLFSHPRGRKAGFLLSRLWPGVVESAMARTRLSDVSAHI